MILEALVGTLVSLASLLISPAPSISRENRRQRLDLIFEGCPVEEEVDEGLIHREYEEEEQPVAPYYEAFEASVSTNINNQKNRSVCQSFRRSLQVNIGLLLAAILLGLITIALVYVDLNTTNSCIERRHFNHPIPLSVKVLQIIGTCCAAIPLYCAWFPVCIAMLWGVKELKQNYLSCLFASFLTVTLTMVYRGVFFNKYTTTSTYRLPDNVLFVCTILGCVYLVTRKFKQINPTVNYSFGQIFFNLCFTFLAGTVVAYLHTYVIIKHFKETQNKIKRAVFAAIIPGIVMFPTAVGKYLMLRRSSKMIPADRTFVMCYFLRGAAIGLYRTMQADFQNIWLFIGLSLLHGISNVVSKATLNCRIYIWKCFIGCVNHARCGPTLEVLRSDKPRDRRFNADLEIQNILFEYTTAILSQAYLVLYLVMNFDVQPWQVIQSSLIRICISAAIDFMFNIISVFIQVHCYDIPMARVWMLYWRRHVIANALIIVCMVAYFGAPLVSVFEAREDTLREYNVRNCTAFL